MSQLERITKVLSKKGTGQGLTAEAIAKAAGVSKDTVYKRIYDLRNVEGRKVYSNFRNVKGQRTMFYRLARSA
jgi:transposase